MKLDTPTNGTLDGTLKRFHMSLTHCLTAPIDSLSRKFISGRLAGEIMI